MASVHAGKTISKSPKDWSTLDTITHVWTGLFLPRNALDSLKLEDDGHDYPSSFKIGQLAQTTIALSALSAALIYSLRQQKPSVPLVSVPLRHACLEFQTEKLFTIDGKPPGSVWGPLGGLHEARDGYVRIHDGFSNHREGALELLGLGKEAGREDVGSEVKKWGKLELEEEGYRRKLAIYALRSYEEWDELPQAKAVAGFPVLLKKIDDDGVKGLPVSLGGAVDRCLQGLRVLELSRVIAAPVAGKTLAAHGADVLWVTSPSLPDLPALDRNLSRGKRSIQLDLDTNKDVGTLQELVKDCDVFIQSYRPGSLAARGFGPADLAALKPGIVYVNLSAFGPSGPWSDRRGFDSLVQTCSGMNVSEAGHFNDGSVARPMPCQALDYAAGYLLATGVAAALYQKTIEGGSWEVNVSLAGVMKFLRGLGQRPGREGFTFDDPALSIAGDYFEEQESAFGLCRGLKHAAHVEGASPGWDRMPRPLGSDQPRWL